MIKLSFLIPTTPDRKKQTDKLVREINRQARYSKLMKTIEVVTLEDNKEMTIGKKRQELYKMAKGIYSVQWDSDDWIHPFAIEMMMEGVTKYKINKTDIEALPDCITYKELIIWDGKSAATSNFSLSYPDWKDNQDGYNFVRTPFFKTPIKTSICLETEIPDIRFGEDHAFAQNIKPKLKTERYIDEFIYWYTPYRSEHNDRYGIK